MKKVPSTSWPSTIEEYTEQYTTPEPVLLASLSRETHLTQVNPRMLAGHMQGTLLRMISRMLRPWRILEIGTFTGYSAICFAEGLDHSGGALHTIDVNPELEEMVMRYVKEAGLQDVIHLHIGDALKIIPLLKETWDLVYIDADKPNYLNYYKMVLPLVRQGGFILADNALWDGKVLDKDTTEKEARGIMEFNQFVRDDSRVENILLPFRDGLMVIRKL